MQYTSSEANKLLRKLKEEKDAVLLREKQCATFQAALGEDVESVRPEYNYAAVQEELKELDRKIRVVKHAINCFNISHMVPELEMTVDEVLVYIPQLTLKRQKLFQMKSRLPKQREHAMFSHNTPIIDYMYANYDIQTVQEEFERVTEELTQAQTALDVLNNTQKMEILL